MESFLLIGKNVGIDGKAPFAKGVLVIGHRVEYEQFSCLFATFSHAETLQVSIQRRFIMFQTHNRRNDNTFSTPSQYDKDHKDSPMKAGKMEITSYMSTPSGSGSRTPAPKKTQTYVDFNSKIPVYDGRNQAFDPNDITGSLSCLPMYEGEVPEGSGAVVAYSAATSKYNSAWRLSFYIQWIVVIAD